MEVYTIQLARWRLCKARGIPLLDTTTRTGDPVFHPGWDIVTGVKDGHITEEEYTEVYLGRMRESYLKNASRWNEVLKMEQVALACYCSPGKFCHRHLLKDIFMKLCRHHDVPFTYQGEIRD